ncbi:hypothetical protein BDR22DRAFT_818533 [Usnea florida]
METYTPHEMIRLSVIFMIPVGLQTWTWQQCVALSASPLLSSAVCVIVISNAAMPCTELLSQPPCTGVSGSHRDIVHNGQVILTHTLKSFYKANPPNTHLRFNLADRAPKSDWTIQMLSPLTIGLSKMSIILLYRTLVALAVTTLWTVAVTIVTICQYRPVSFYWDEVESFWGNKCIQSVLYYEAETTTTDIILDFTILAMPIPMIWKLRMPVKQKLVVASVVLLDITSPVFIWSLIEASLTVTSACVPTLRPVFDRKLYYQGYDSTKYT